MAIKTNTANQPPEKSIEEIYEVASASVAAQTLIDSLGPQLERAFMARLATLFQAPAELGAVLDARAQLKAVWDLKKGLSDQMKKGQGAVEIMNQLLLKSVQ